MIELLLVSGQLQPSTPHPPLTNWFTNSTLKSLLRKPEPRPPPGTLILPSMTWNSSASSAEDGRQWNGGDFFTERLGNVEFVVCRDDGKLQAFHNICRHHASLLASSTGKKSCFVCPYHVFCDNYLDGGYHVPYAHKGLASGLQVSSYSTILQSCEGSSTGSGDDVARLGSKALYAFIYPNFMVNRCGPWMDTNLVLPLRPRKCQVIFDYFLEPHLKDDKAFIERSLAESEAVQMEDIVLCEGVQRGLESPAYESSRYAPTVEEAMYHFHSLLHHNLKP